MKDKSKRIDEMASQAFHDKLSRGHELFRDYPELILPAFNLMKAILRIQYEKEDRPVGFYSKITENIFSNRIRKINKQINKDKQSKQPGLRGFGNRPSYISGKTDTLSYTHAVEALIEMGLITQEYDEIHASYQAKGKKIKGKSRTHSVTSKGKKLIEGSFYEHFIRIHEEKKPRRRIGKNLSAKRMKASKKYKGNDFFQHLHDTLMGLDYDYATVREKIDAELVDFRAEDLKYQRKEAKAFSRVNPTIINLIDLRTKSFRSLRNSKTNKRVWHQFIGLKNTYRKFFNWNGLSYAAIIDQRASHPSLLGLYCKRFIEKLGKQKSKTPSQKFLDEIERYNKLFNGIDDPRISIAKELGVKPEYVKAAFNTWINGGKEIKLKSELSKKGNPKKNRKIIPELSEWMAKSFPEMFEMLGKILDKKIKQLFKKDIGLTISKDYETEIFQDFELYKLGDDLGLRVINEHDGIGIFAKDEGQDLQTKLDKLKRHIEERSRAVLGFPIVVKVQVLEPNPN